MTSSSMLRFVPYLPAALLTLTGLVANATPPPPSLDVKRLVLAHGVSGREPTGATTTFNAGDDRVYAFVEIANPNKNESAILVTFEPPSGRADASPEIRLAIDAASHDRTWAFTRHARQPGIWTVVIRDTRGHELARAPFTVAK